MVQHGKLVVVHLCPKDLGVKVDQAGHCAHQDPQGLSLCQGHPDNARCSV